MKVINIKSKRFFLFSLVCILFTLISATSTNFRASQNEAPTKVKKYYQVVLVWVKNPQKYQEYVQKLGPVVSKYESNAERIISPVKSFFAVKKGKELKTPHMINIVYYKSKKAYHKFLKDPEYIKLKKLRSEAIDIAGIDGEVIGGKLEKGNVADRLYMIEFLNYKNKKSYNNYIKKTKPYYKRHLVNERILKPDNVFGNINMPDVVFIKYIKNEADRSKMETDKEHPMVEKLYGDMLSDLVWIEGKAAYVNMD